MHQNHWVWDWLFDYSPIYCFRQLLIFIVCMSLKYKQNDREYYFGRSILLLKHICRLTTLYIDIIEIALNYDHFKSLSNGLHIV